MQHRRFPAGLAAGCARIIVAQVAVRYFWMGEARQARGVGMSIRSPGMVDWFFDAVERYVFPVLVVALTLGSVGAGLLSDETENWLLHQISIFSDEESTR